MFSSLSTLTCIMKTERLITSCHHFSSPYWPEVFSTFMDQIIRSDATLCHTVCGLCCVFYHSSTYTFSLGKTPGFISSRSFIRVSIRTWAELDRNSRPHVTAAMSDWWEIKTREVIGGRPVWSRCEPLTHFQFMLHSGPDTNDFKLSTHFNVFDMVAMSWLQFPVLFFSIGLRHDKLYICNTYIHVSWGQEMRFGTWIMSCCDSVDPGKAQWCTTYWRTE